MNVQSVISLLLTLGKEPKATTTMVDFTMVKVPSTYNDLLSHPSQNALRVSRSSPHLKMKFPTPYDIGILKGDKQVTKQCYDTDVKSNGQVFISWINEKRRDPNKIIKYVG